MTYADVAPLLQLPVPSIFNGYESKLEALNLCLHS